MLKCLGHDLVWVGRCPNDGHGQHHWGRLIIDGWRVLVVFADGHGGRGGHGGSEIGNSVCGCLCFWPSMMCMPGTCVGICRLFSGAHGGHE
jgi:hypothetical protein